MIRNWLRQRLRQWLQVEEGQKLSAKALTDLTAVCATLQERSTLAWERIVAIEVEHSALSKKQAELSAIRQEVRELREMLADPKRQPIVARTTHQFRALMEQE